MSYTKQNFEDGQVLNSNQLNHIEDGIVALEEQIAAISNATVADYDGSITVE